MERYKHISVAVPMMDELVNLPILLECLRTQKYKEFTLYCCVNHPESFVKTHSEVCARNRESLRLLRAVMDIDVVLIDHATAGCGWGEKKKGVGWARKELFAKIMEERDEDEIVVSLDADTVFGSGYLGAIVGAFNAEPDASAVCVPYYHPLCGNESLDRALLRYECYMRHYLTQMLRIRSRYAFSALGSAMAFPLWAYRRVGGITPLQGGEDYYLMQKFAKTGRILMSPKRFSTSLPGIPELCDTECVCPQGRVSSRVPFGTGPSVAQGISFQEEHYPFYPTEAFDEVKRTFDLFPSLFEGDIETPMTSFLKQQLATDEIWSPMRKNFKNRSLFVRACEERVDGLRILQFLRWWVRENGNGFQPPVDFASDGVDRLNDYRNELFVSEMKLRR